MAEAMGKDTSSVPEGEKQFLFIETLKEMQNNCGADTLKMSAYGIKKDELPRLAQNAFDTMSGLFELDRYTLSFEDAVSILEGASS